MNRITFVSGGVGKNCMTPAAKRACREAEAVFAPSEKLAFYASLRAFAPTPLDGCYRQAEDFNHLNRLIAEEVFKAEGHVAFVCYGSAAEDELCRHMAARAKEEGIPFGVVPGVSVAEAARAAAGLCEEVTARNALSPFAEAQVSRAAVYYGIADRLIAGELKTYLLAHYPAELPVFLFSEKERFSLPLFEMDRQKRYHHSTALVLPALPFLQAPAKDFSHLLAVMRQLLSPGGCAWDREQTHESLKPCLLEECYEVQTAIDEKDDALLCEELGDVLLQVVFHALIAEKHGEFTLPEVIGGLADKLIYRHPHVFGSASAATSEEVIKNWDAIKRKQKNESVQGTMRALPKGFPALLRGQKLWQKAMRAGLAEKMPPEGLEEALSRLRQAANSQEVAAALGETLFLLCRLAEASGVSAELACQKAGEAYTESLQ